MMQPERWGRPLRAEPPAFRPGARDGDMGGSAAKAHDSEQRGTGVACERP